ncbi:FKBP-type peptidyl-prolyl cis-trans isomerase N-terminal domain-containing protein [Serratia sp. root2]|uniref:FKBP-type peptidyl-prolyl cis-trans isomerase N-terminal domain-containing protein n=1 Tax=Serratia sp. root2 TaxID=3059676 RepID=UPI00288DA43E|nr:FKBP-type peptidyl-prolyl cis-trans isomerase N-terminal domain-containing protein [Serratia sp. root2]MDT3254049.1 FKBP-type peptidyl-prolyl cis-trans isomerase N-terminal domain-containing protein [Serratia sp. root2]
MSQKKWLFTRSYSTLAALMISSNVLADDGVPALLQFAEQYQQQVLEKPATTEKITTPGAAISTKNPTQPARRPDKPSTAAPPTKPSTQHQLLLASKQQLARQRIELETLRKEVSALRAEKISLPVVIPPKLPDLQPLKQWVVSLGDAWRGSPDAQRTTALLREAIKQKDLAKKMAAQANEQIKSLKVAAQKTEAEREKLHRESEDTLQALRATLQDNEQQLAKQKAIIDQAQTELATLHKRTSWNMTPEQLAQEKTRLSYAAGSTLGQDIQAMIAERQEWGVPVERDALLAGVIDSVSGQLQLPQEQLAQLMVKTDATASAARDKRLQAQAISDEDYLNKFKKLKGATLSPMGFWYRVDYAGDSELAKDAVIDVVVKETLTDNTVIQDMDLNGKVLSQPISAFPPLFQEAISYLRNHGSLTLVVPPALAYGETGYPPKVPPNATMVYTLRIDNSHTP